MAVLDTIQGYFCTGGINRNTPNRFTPSCLINNPEYDTSSS